MPLLTTLRFVGQMLFGIGIQECEHLREVAAHEPAAHECADCIAAGAKWFHLRMCATCGYVGCCDSSSLKHMTSHAAETGHPVARSIEGKESWAWCYFHDRLVSRKLD